MFLNSMYQRFTHDPSYRFMLRTEEPWVGYFDFCFERSSSLTKGRQTQCYKIIPPNLTPEQAMALAMERDRAYGSRSSPLKLLQDFMVFFYVTDAPIPPATLAYLADFQRVRKSVFGNVSQLCFLLETANGSYLAPQKLGWFGWLPIKMLRDELQRDILESFRVWRRQQTQTPMPPQPPPARP